MKLTAKRVEKLKKPRRYGDGAGLYLQITESGTKSWVLRYERDGRERMLGLGTVRDFTLKEARERARAARQQLADGIDPIDARRATRTARALEAAKNITLKVAAQQYFDQHERKWRNEKHRAQFMSSLEAYVFDKIGNLPVNAIDIGLVLKCLEPIWHDKTETANRVRGRLETVLDWATVRGYRSGDNPARWRGHLENALPARRQIQKPVHHPALPYVEIAPFVAALREREGVAPRALEFAILTAARTGEAIGATWKEIDLKAKVWTVPAGRIKGGREHRVPLSDRAVEILEALPTETGNDFIFIGPLANGMSNMALLAVLGRMGRKDITVHGFRSTFRDWAAECSNYPNEVVEMALAHTVGNKVEAAYRRGDLFDKRRNLMADWATYCDRPPIKSADVVPMRGQR